MMEGRVTQVRLESRRLGQYLRGLPEGAWEQPSACQRWAIGDVVAHLVGGAQMYSEHIFRGLQGDAAAPEGFPPPGASDPEVLGSLNAHRAIFRRTGLGDQLLTAFQTSDDQLNQLMAGLSLPDWGKPCYHPIGILPVRTFVSLRMFELALHGWDVASRLEPDAGLSADCCPMLLELVSSAGRGMVVQIAVGNASDARYRFKLGDIALGDYDLVVGEGGARIEAAGEEPADGVVRCSAADFLLLVTGRIQPGSALGAGRLAAEEGNVLPLVFGDWFKGVWRPKNG